MAPNFVVVVVVVVAVAVVALSLSLSRSLGSSALDGNKMAPNGTVNGGTSETNSIVDEGQKNSVKKKIPGK